MPETRGLFTQNFSDTKDIFTQCDGQHWDITKKNQDIKQAIRNCETAGRYIHKCAKHQGDTDTPDTREMLYKSVIKQGYSYTDVPDTKEHLNPLIKSLHVL